jgi:uncharacterized protein (DUF1800 family)
MGQRLQEKGRGLAMAFGPSLGLACLLSLAACGGGSASDETTVAPEAGSRQRAQALVAGGAAATTVADAVRLAQQASFGPTEDLVAEISTLGPAAWLQQQVNAQGLGYRSGGNDAIHRNLSKLAFCETGQRKDDPNCWRDNYATEPLAWDFYRNAIEQPDQLRQRVAMALAHVLVVSGHEVAGTYGLRNYQNNLLHHALGNYRDVLRKVILSPVMGDYLDHVNNDKTAPNENFARELLQLFSLGTCKLNADGTQQGKRCKPVYDNTMVRRYAFALTGWTYPAGGRSPWGCWPEGANCLYYGGDMTSAPALRNHDPQSLLSNVTVPAGVEAPEALDAVLDSLFKHGNLAPFVSRRLIQHLVTSNPSAEYVGRVSAVFQVGRFKYTDATGSFRFGRGQRGDLAATVAAILLDSEARDPAEDMAAAGHLRAPVLLFTGALRAFNGHTDGAALGWWWGEGLKQHVFMSPSVFGFYPPDYPVPGSTRIGPEFGIHNTNGALERLNYLTYLFDWGGSAPDPSVPNAVGTGVDVTAFLTDTGDPAALVDRVSNLTLGRPLVGAPRQKVLSAVRYWDRHTDPDHWRERRVQTAAYLVLSSPDFQVQR